MAIGRNFKESFQKCMRSLETDRHGWGADGKDSADQALLRESLKNQGNDTGFFMRYALQRGWTPEEVQKLAGISNDDLAKAQKDVEKNPLLLFQLPNRSF